MLIFWRLVFGHFLADFTLQSNRVNELKRDSHAGMLIHCLTHPLCYILLTFPYLSDVWIRILGVPIHGWTAITLITLIHYAEDVWRVHNIKRVGLPDNTLYLIWDQVIHLSAIFVFFGTDAGQEDWHTLIPEAWPVLGTLAVLSTHFSVVFIYFIEKDWQHKSYPHDWEKHVAIAERGLAFLTLALISDLRWAWLGALTALLAPRILAMRINRSIERPPSVAWALGGLIALGSGFLGRLL